VSVDVHIKLKVSLALYVRPLLSLCIMATKAREYRAKGSSRKSARDRETAQPTIDISEILLGHFGASQRVSASHILYQGNQFSPGDLVDREVIASVFKRSLQL
jgi:hypothetical protein